MSYQAAVTAPHHLAAKAGEQILNQGGNAVEACIAMASTLTVVYPHMTSLGGDGFWLIHKPGCKPISINAAGICGSEVDIAAFGESERGGKAALTTAGAVSGWQAALTQYPGQLSLDTLFATAISHGETGFKVTQTLHDAQKKLLGEGISDDFAKVYLKDGQPYSVGDTLRLPALAGTYRKLAELGLQSWYTGELATTNVAYLRGQGSPLTLADLAQTEARFETPLSLQTQWGEFLNLAAPTQGGASLNILGLLDRFISQQGSEQDWQSAELEEKGLHALVEAVKQAFNWRNSNLADPNAMPVSYSEQLSAESLDKQFAAIDDQAAPWPTPGPVGDTVWMGVG